MRASLGQAASAAAMIALGTLGLIGSRYAAVWNGVPKGTPGHEPWLYVCAVVVLACAIGWAACDAEDRGTQS